MEAENAETAPRNDSLWILKSIFSKKSSGDGGGDGSNTSPSSNSPLPFLSPHANSVVARCSKILSIPTKELQAQFDVELPDNLRLPPSYARNFLEFCSYKALHLAITRPNYLNDKEFCRLTFDMMVAWEDPGVDSNLLDKETASCSNQDAEGEDGWSLFYSNSTKMAVQVDDKKTVGPEAFARIAPTCPVIADVTTVHNLFDVLTSSSGPRLHYLIYDKYLRSLEKVAKFAQNAVGPQVISTLSLVDGEIIIDVDGTVPTQPVLQHIGMSAWPGRLTLTNYALYFEPGVGLYDKAVKYDLATDLKQVIKPELTGPLGARLFDKAVMYKSTSIAEPVYLEFPEFKGCSRRDYWLDICLEILRAHRFSRKYNLKGNQKSEVLARAILGIFRFRAVREAFRVSSSNYKTLLCFNLAESLPGGDMIMETLAGRIILITPTAGQQEVSSSPNANRRHIFPAALMTLIRLKIVSLKEGEVNREATYLAGDLHVGELNPLEAVVKQLELDTGKAEAAQATVDQVKVEGIDTNLAVMKELLFPVIETYNRLDRLASWNDPYKSVMFVLLFSYLIIRGWTKYILPSIFVFLALMMLWRKYVWRRRPLESFKIVAPPGKNAVEQLILLQEAIAQVESFIQSGNVALLKIRALLFAVAPKATDKLTFLLVAMASVLIFVPLKYLMLIAFLEYFTRYMPLRREDSERGMRRLKEWWIRIPAAPVEIVKPDDKKRR
ncbi:polygalacturonase inhibitor [Perilla frutescens var. hirtella]|uniref:Polygalacturonase inhibitor n=1 Tax=Perilla frutescens var. hirtella TaxID=608512 RepID=A0AAD4JPW3_PERFH|nr:polygalacturonase inhibitor [Perilla frutescens var. hirtella]